MKAMKRRGNGAQALASASVSSTPLLTPQSSTYPSEDEDEGAPEDGDEETAATKQKPFKFLELPSELRNEIYGLIFYEAPSVIDLDPDNFRHIHRKISVFLVCRQICDEASHHFYSTHTIRLFPTYPGKFFKAKKPLLARLSPRNRASISTLQLRLGPGWNNPPRGWVVNEALGLRDAVNVRILKCFVEVDPSDSVFAGFRRGIDYGQFSRTLLTEVLDEVPSVAEIQFDAWPSVKKDGDMMRGLIETARQQKKLISWGKEKGWSDEEDADLVKSMSRASILPTKTLGIGCSYECVCA